VVQVLTAARGSRPANLGRAVAQLPAGKEPPSGAGLGEQLASTRNGP
jgi:hypothetical protein